MGERLPGLTGMGFPWKIATVVSITSDDPRLCVVRDQFGKYQTLRRDLTRAKGGQPQVGEKWLIDTVLGYWTFACALEVPLPVVTGETDGIPALRSLIDALAFHGFIEDQTTDDRVRATHPHTHPGGTGEDVL